MTASLKIALADDEQVIHDSVGRMIAAEFPDSTLEHHFDTEAVKDRLVADPGDLDLLLLDVHFAGGESGIEALPEIRELGPGLPIILLTGETDPSLIREAVPYRIDYLQKPVSASTLTIHIHQHLDAMTELILLEERVQQLTGKLQAAEVREMPPSGKSVPPDLRELMRTVFPDVEFEPRALKRVVRADRRLFRVLKAIDWKAPIDELGTRPKKFRAKYEGEAWEYRFAGRYGRIFVKYPKGSPPLIVDIEFGHKHA